MSKNTMQRVRPDQTYALLPASGPTFPRGHTFSAFAFYGFLAVIYEGQGHRIAHARTVTLISVAVIFLVGLSRIYVGAHWPSDVLGSIFLGSSWLALIGLVLASFRESRPKNLPKTAVTNSGRWIVLAVLLWAAFIVVFAYLKSPAEPSAAIA